MKTGIVILNYNDVENTIKLIDSIKDYKCLSKIVIVDNNSSDNSIDELKKYESKKIKLIEATKNNGYGAGNNLGLKYLQDETKCEYVIISNPDIEVEESVIINLIKDLDDNVEISFLGPKILENGLISKGWKLPRFSSELVSNINYFSKYQKKMIKYKDTYYNNNLTEVEAIHGCFFIGRLDAFKKIKNFDEKTFLYYEENILAFKAKANGLGVYVDTSLSVTHHLSKSVNKSFNKVRKYILLKNSQKYYVKKYMKLNIVGYIILRLFYYISLGICALTFWI